MSYPLVNRRGKTMTWWAFNTYDPVAKRLNFGEYNMLRDKFLVPYINPPQGDQEQRKPKRGTP